MSPLKKETLPVSLQGRLLFGDKDQLQALKGLSPKPKKKTFKPDEREEIIATLIYHFGGKEIKVW